MQIAHCARNVTGSSGDSLDKIRLPKGMNYSRNFEKQLGKEKLTA